jgi:LacI family transcriptional regulator
LSLAAPRVQDARIAVLNALGLPYVVHGRTEIDAPYCYVDVDNDAIFAKAATL